MINPSWYNIQQYLNGSWLIYRQIVKSVEFKDEESVLDVGCGTGTILFELEQKASGAKLTGIDPSERMVIFARAENQKRGSGITFRRGFGEHLDFKEDTFDWVVSSLTFHHLPREIQKETLEEMVRVLKPGGRLLIVDFGKPRTSLGKVIAATLQGHAFTADTLSGSVGEILEDSILTGIKTEQTQFGIVEYLSAVKPLESKGGDRA